MFVCMCFGVTDKDIKQVVVSDGAGNIRELKKTLQIGSNCGKCLHAAQQIIDDTIINQSMFKNVG